MANAVKVGRRGKSAKQTTTDKRPAWESMSDAQLEEAIGALSSALRAAEDERERGRSELLLLPDFRRRMADLNQEVTNLESELAEATALISKRRRNRARAAEHQRQREIEKMGDQARAELLETWREVQQAHRKRVRNLARFNGIWSRDRDQLAPPFAKAKARFDALLSALAADLGFSSPAEMMKTPGGGIIRKELLAIAEEAGTCDIPKFEGQSGFGGWEGVGLAFGRLAENIRQAGRIP